MLTGSHIDPKAGKVSLRSFAYDRWLPSVVHVRPNTRSTYKSHLKTHILPLLGDRRISALRRTDMKSFVAALRGKGLAAATISTVYAVLRAMMQAAVDDGLIPGNPCSRVPLPRVEQRVLKPLTAAEVQRLAKAITPRYEVAVWLGAGAGLREGEVLGLTVPRIDFLGGRRILVEEQMQNGELSPLKTRASRRAVPLDDLVLNKVAAHLQRWPSQGLVITNRCGRPVRRSSFGFCWSEAVKKAGLPTGTRFHDLRHFYASTLIAAGLHPKTIQARLGHATMAETMDTYGHLFPEADEQGRGALDAAFAADVPQKRPDQAQ
ncbi:tyrosine-type recombinase/integrase [Streptomyces nigra]